MILSETVSYWLLEYCSIHSWQDALEIIFFTTVIYTISTWLKQDKNNRLLVGFYGYTALFCATYFFDLPTLQHSLLFAAPVIATLSIIYHQKQLQKNFILARKEPLHPEKIAAPNWIETCIRSCLVVAHQKKEITCIIERNDNLDSMIDRSLLIDIHMQKDILNLLLLSDAFHPEQPILLTKTGNILSINCSWNESLTDTLFSTSSQHPKWQSYGALITQKTDALIFHINSDTSKGGISYQGEIVTKMTSEQILQFVKQAMHKDDKPNVSYKKGSKNESKQRPSL